MVRVQLQLDPFVETHASNLGHIGGAWSERQPVQRMDDLSVDGEFLIEPACGTASDGKGSEQHRCTDSE